MTEGGGEDNCQLTSSTTHTPQPLDSPTTPLYSILFYSIFLALSGTWIDIMDCFLEWWFWCSGQRFVLWSTICGKIWHRGNRFSIHPALRLTFTSWMFWCILYSYMFICVFSRRVLQCSNLHLQLAKPNLQSEWKIIVVGLNCTSNFHSGRARL